VQIDLSTIDRDSFNLKEGVVNGREVILINPKDFACVWSRQNLNQRSLIVDKSGNILSHGLFKFFNYGEKPDLYPNPDNAKDGTLVEKIDGSCVLFDWIDGLNARTRGTLSYKTLVNAPDFDFVLKKYPNLENIVRANPDYTYIAEITTPNQKIVLDYGQEPELYYLGCIHKETGLYTPFFADTDYTIDKIGCKVPAIYDLKGSLAEIYEQIKIWEKKEGAVLVYNDNQSMVKLKCLSYLKLHYFKSTCNLNSLLDLYFEWSCPHIPDFRDKLAANFDFECLTQASPLIGNIQDAIDVAEDKIIEFCIIKDANRDLNQKDYALKVLAEYKENSSYLFELRAKGMLSPKSLRKLLEKELELV